jgi:hypothetical protein
MSTRALARAASHAAREVASASSAARPAAGHATRASAAFAGWHNGRHCVFPAVTTRSVSPAFGARARTFISLPAGSGRLADLATAAREGLASARAAPIAARDAAARRARAELEKLVGPRVSLTLERCARSSATIPFVLLNPMPHVARASNEARALLFRHGDALELVAQGVAVLVVWHGGLTVASLSSSAPATASSELAALGFAAAFVLAGSSALKRRTRVDVDSAHATLLRRVGAHAGLREVLGSPIVGARGNARVALVTGGEWRRDDEGTTIQTNDSKPLYKNADRSGGSAKPTRSRSSRSFFALPFTPTGNVTRRKKWRWRDERAHVAFPVAGSRARGMVAAEIVKRAGYPPAFELVAVDVEAENGRDAHRLYLAGGLRERERADAVVAALRAPLGVALDEAYDALRAGDARRAEETRNEKRKTAAAAAAARVPKPLDEGGGMWPAERAMDTAASIAHGARRLWGRATGRRST